MEKSGWLLALAMIACTTGMGQQRASLQQEYWVVETHYRDTVYSVVKFYDRTNSLLHEVRIENIAIDIQQKKYRKKLNQMLEEYKARTSSSMRRYRSKSSV